MDTRLPVLINLILGLLAWAVVRGLGGGNLWAAVVGCGVAVMLTLAYALCRASSDANDKYDGYR